MEKKNRQEIERALKSARIIEKIIPHVCCFFIFGTMSIVLLLKFNTFWGYIGCAICTMIVLTTMFNTITNISIMNKIKRGNFKHITEKLISISPCSALIPGRADYLQASTNSYQFFINKFTDVNFQIGDIVDAVFLGTENVPIHIAKIEKEKEENIEMNQQPKNLIKENQNKGFSLVPVIAPFLIVLIITIIAIIYPFVK